MKNILTCSCGEKWRAEAYLALRIATGLAFFFHGYQKVFVTGVENVIPFFAQLGIPFATVATYLVAYGELLGGLALMFGFLTHWVCKALIVIMVGAIGFAHWGAEGGWFFGYGAPGGYEYPLLLLVVTIYLLTAGPGRYSVDARRRTMTPPPMQSTPSNPS